jgi:hypothetical protein
VFLKQQNKQVMVFLMQNSGITWLVALEPKPPVQIFCKNYKLGFKNSKIKSHGIFQVKFVCYVVGGTQTQTTKINKSQHLSHGTWLVALEPPNLTLVRSTSSINSPITCLYLYCSFVAHTLEQTEYKLIV